MYRYATSREDDNGSRAFTDASREARAETPALKFYVHACIHEGRQSRIYRSQLGLGVREHRAGSGYLPTGSARYRGRQRRLNVPICPRARSPEAIHPRLPFVRLPRLPQEPPRRSIQTTSPYHLTAPPPTVRLETVTRKKLTDRTRSFSFCGRGQMNSFETSLGERYSLVSAASFFFFFFF